MTKKKLKKLEKRQLNLQFRDWALKVKERDRWVCAICQRKEFLDAHHLFPREIKALRFELDNGITLCKSHHRFSFELSAHQNPIAFLMWLTKNKKDQLERLLDLLVGNTDDKTAPKGL